MADVPANMAKRFSSRPSLSPSKKASWLGAFYAHYLVWEEVASLNHGCFILEDDCMLLKDRDMPLAADLPTNSVLFLGGWLAGRPILKRNDRSWFFGIDGFLKQLATLPLKASIVPQDAFTIMNCVCYWMPPQVARYLVQAAKAGGVQVPDVYLNRQLQQTPGRNSKMQIWFPNCPMDVSTGSQASTPDADAISDLYMSQHTRNRARQLGHPPPERGSDMLSCFKWQLFLAQKLLATHGDP